MVDEAHQILTSSDFRPDLKHIDKLREIALPKIYLTATLSPNHQLDFIRNIGLNPESVRVVRAPTGRKELRYHNVAVRNARDTALVVTKLTYECYLQGIVKPDSRVIIFCHSITDAGVAAACLGCLKYHGQMPMDERNATQEAWMAGKTPADRCIAATSALVHGVDAPYVDLIIFFNLPHSAVDFIQAAARGGRRGRPCMVILVHSNKPIQVPIAKRDYGLANVMNKFAENQSQCRRILLTGAMDTRSFPCDSLEGDQLCDICQPQTEMTAIINSCLVLKGSKIPPNNCLRTLEDPAPAPQPPAIITVDDEDEYMYDNELSDDVLARVEMPVLTPPQPVSFWSSV